MTQVAQVRAWRLSVGLTAITYRDDEVSTWHELHLLEDRQDERCSICYPVCQDADSCGDSVHPPHVGKACSFCPCGWHGSLD